MVRRLHYPCRNIRASLKSRLGGGWRSQAGFTLIELMVVSALLIIVLGALLDPLATVGKTEPQDVEWGHALVEGRVGIQRLSREVRQAYSVVAATPYSVSFLVTLAGQSQQVFYECDIAAPVVPNNPYSSGYRQCLRVSAPVGSALPAISSGQVVIDRVLNGTTTDPNDPVFTYTPNALNPTVIETKVVLPSRGSRNDSKDHNIVLDAGAYLRNLNLGG